MCECVYHLSIGEKKGFSVRTQVALKCVEISNLSKNRGSKNQEFSHQNEEFLHPKNLDLVNNTSAYTQVGWLHQRIHKVCVNLFCEILNTINP